MKNLTVENIQFIQTYLKNSGVIFIDVRLEMTDHVASAMEEKLNENPGLEFYDAFKSYMILHKKELLKNSFKYRWDLDKKVLKMIGKNMFHPLIAGLFIVVLVMYYLLDFPSVNLEYILIPQAILGSFVIVPLLLYRYLKVSFIHHLVFIVYLFNSNLVHFGIGVAGKTATIFTLIAFLSLWINLSALKTIFESFQYYKGKFKEA